MSTTLDFALDQTNYFVRAQCCNGTRKAARPIVGAAVVRDPCHDGRGSKFDEAANRIAMLHNTLD